MGKRFSRLRRRTGHDRERHEKTGADVAFDVAGNVAFDALDGVPIIAVILLTIAAITILWFAVIPLVLVLFDVVVVIIGLVVLTLIRLLLRRPWTVAATPTIGAEIEREVVGWQASGDELDRLGKEIEAGRVPLR